MTVNPYSRDRRSRPNFPDIMKEALEEEKKSEDEGIWRVIVRRDKDLQEKLKQKEEELLEEMSDNSSLEEKILGGSEEEKLEKSIEDLL